MQAVIEAFAKAFGQLGDTAILRVLAKSVIATVFVFIAVGVGLYFALVLIGSSYAQGSSGFAEAAAAAILAGLAFWFLFRVVAVAVLQFFADEVVAAVEAKHYPDAAMRARPLPFRRDLSNSLRGIGRTMGVNLLALPVAVLLLITGVGPALVFLAVNAWLLGRELTDMAWFRHCYSDTVVGGDDPAKNNPVPRVQRIALGAIVAVIMVVPFANLIAPIIGAAAGTHLAQNAMACRRIENTKTDSDENTGHDIGS